jgi:6-phosphogluconolactonase
MAWTLAQYASDAELVPVLAGEIAATLTAAVQARGRATLAVSGGSTPRGLFAALAASDLPWADITVTLVDERWVSSEHADANARLVRDHLLQGPAASARFVGLTTSAASPFEAVAEVDERLRAQAMPLDVAVLGMGEDGHTASFFPGAAELPAALNDAQRLCCGIRPPCAPHLRMTLTLSCLLGASRLFLHLVGAGKRAVLEAAMQEGPVAALPVRAVLHNPRLPLEIHYAEKP